MDIKELRIGNWVQLEEGPETEVQVNYLNEDSEGVGLCGNAIINRVGDIEGIPLTEEWLMRMGFEWIGQIEKWGLKTITIRIDQPSYVQLLGQPCKHIQCVHQIQNLYAIYYGEELIIK